MEATLSFVELKQRTRANSARLAALIKKAQALIDRSGDILQRAANVNPMCRVGNTVGSVTPEAVKTWLLAIASNIHDWPRMPKEMIGSSMAEATPPEAAKYILDW